MRYFRPFSMENGTAAETMGKTGERSCSAKETPEPASIVTVYCRLTGMLDQIGPENCRLLFGHQHPKDIGIMAVCRIQSPNGLKPDHQAATGILMTPPDQRAMAFHSFLPESGTIWRGYRMSAMACRSCGTKWAAFGGA
ncbi:MAG: hypothetical protein ABIT09_01230 [Croceibacterium sp.]